MVSEKERRVALFIDFENLVTNTGISPATFDLQPAMDRLLEKARWCSGGHIATGPGSRSHSPFARLRSGADRRAALDARREERADMRLVIDALELCYAREHIDTFAIASGDSDFCPLAYKLRENNRVLIALGVKEATSPCS